MKSHLIEDGLMQSSIYAFRLEPLMRNKIFNPHKRNEDLLSEMNRLFSTVGSLRHSHNTSEVKRVKLKKPICLMIKSKSKQICPTYMHTLTPKNVGYLPVLAKTSNTYKNIKL
jgi:hypothetical protein